MRPLSIRYCRCIKMKVIFIVIVAFIWLLWPATISAAKPTTDITVSPAITEWLVAPGNTLTKTILLVNTTDKLVPIQAVVSGLDVDQPASEQNRAVYDASKWFTVGKPDFILRPKQAKKVTVRMSAPQKAEPGGHYATIHFRQLSPISARRQTNVVASIGTLAFIVVKGRIVKWLQPGSLTAEKQSGKLVVKASIHNTGNVHAIPEGELPVVRVSGKPAAKLPMSARKWGLAPKNSSAISAKA
ncbi:hypothetical protein TM7_0107 [candidate division TM7 genomosp. GTL1]|nr:hypothetical protein TM7_0107 [candidate division TM7 genomosp. GTL1]